MQPAQPDEWKIYRDLRLRALLDSPDAFGSTYEAEAMRADAMWSARIAAATSSGKDRVLFAFNRNDACGLIWCKLSNDEPAVADLFQMWVDPASRGMGAGRALLKEAISWAESVGANRVHLGVTAGDTPALRLYAACGFRPDGALEPLREHSNLMVQPMNLALGAVESAG
ncbi:GNAT family N-acetyltransferase [Variovorax boronicumulans]|uniref:GNAT family N-acetyltransferase n=1 Tax=Variovorax boronicumulans TaxID=436515 RepID=UPI0012E5EFF9|nr:GNAT family N-acetyltransferase [Variovorax boronicumulans]GER15808.1 N-acetyltransferase [Variovorax boronicumulans]